MSASDRDGRRVELPAVGRPELTAVELEYARMGPAARKRLAALHLYEYVGWPLEEIAALWGHHAGTSSRHVQQAKRELAARLGE